MSIIWVPVHTPRHRYISGFDVALVPNRVTEFTESLDPLKTYQYLAAGVPVVSTSAGVSPELAEQVHVVSTPAELIARAEQLIADDSPAIAETRRLLVSGQTWDARAAAVEETLGIRPPALRGSGISVVVVSFNTRELLRRCLSSVLDQAQQDVQVVVVDNGLPTAASKWSPSSSPMSSSSVWTRT